MYGGKDWRGAVVVGDLFSLFRLHLRGSFDFVLCFWTRTRLCSRLCFLLLLCFLLFCFCFFAFACFSSSSGSFDSFTFALDSDSTDSCILSLFVLFVGDLLLFILLWTRTCRSKLAFAFCLVCRGSFDFSFVICFELVDIYGAFK
ncbi:hypothetical protein C8F01DRAFT_1168847 [Mycena amicta]|nr:hypothetical protein C8F01DRAFT_1168847 [Mycena amicta]